MLFASWVSVSTFSVPNAERYKICTYDGQTGINPFQALRGGFLGLTISGWLLSLVFLIAEFTAPISTIPHRKIVTI